MLSQRSRLRSRKRADVAYNASPVSLGRHQVILSELDRLRITRSRVRCLVIREIPKAPTLNEYEMRKRDMRSRFIDVGIVIPGEVSGWVALSRAAAPH